MYGSNSNGSYIRFADGTQICYSDVVVEYTNSYALIATWTFPAAFSTTPIVSGARDYGNQRIAGTTDPYTVPISVNFRSRGPSGTLVLVNVSSGAAISGDFAKISCVAIGRWY
jgi:hypothetical protein